MCGGCVCVCVLISATPCGLRGQIKKSESNNIINEENHHTHTHVVNYI